MSQSPDAPEPSEEPTDSPDRPEPDTPAWARSPQPPPGSQQPPPGPQQPPPGPGGWPAPAPWSYPPGPPGPPPGPWSPAPGPPGLPPWAGTPPTAPPAERDRLAVHLVWEGFLAVIAVVLLVATVAMTSKGNLTFAFGQAGYLGLAATGLALSLRTASPNLAVGSIVAFTDVLAASLATKHGWGTPVAMITAVVLATVIGFVLGLVVVMLSVPAWAATFGAAALLQAVTLGLSGGTMIPVMSIGSYPTALWFGLFAVVSAGGGALWLVPGVRSRLGAGRGPRDPGRWDGLQSGLGTVAGLTGSSFLAGLAGVALLMRLRAADNVIGPYVITAAFAAVLLGGVSVFGRRAGVFGTLLGVTIVAIIGMLLAYNDVSSWVTNLVTGLVVLVGLGVSRGLESITTVLNRPRPPAPPTGP
ncbi:hypothetical protein NE236_11175 [Actinoallomurus purpureus]|uniref:ABC transporter permease n=1 Tax=Actinoallomurus purpureus TaxID=478114 RepID=UPI002091F833|nr:hypothetical protein [Actinoallomurus purpureus]MCO6005542.1 hypothetical protein [Actinoallomurus purpureus]